MFCADVAIEVTCKAMFLFGGRGIMGGYRVEKLVRDALTLTHGNGTSAVLTARLGSLQADRRIAARAMNVRSPATMAAGVTEGTTAEVHHG